jgi:hypothetical protein
MNRKYMSAENIWEFEYTEMRDYIEYHSSQPTFSIESPYTAAARQYNKYRH